MNIKHEIQPNLPQLLFVINDAAYFLAHHIPSARAARDAGFAVHVAAPDGEKAVLLRDEGFIYHVWPMTRGSKNPFAEIVSFLKLAWILRRVKPDILHLITMKPILYGGIAGRGRAIVAGVMGLGSVFSRDGLRIGALRLFVAFLYRIALKHPRLRVVFQNREDEAIIARIARLKSEKCVLIRGVGVDLMKYAFSPLPLDDQPPIVVLAARLLKPKGVPEFVAAARQLRARGVLARFVLVGLPDAENPETVSENFLAACVAEGVVEHWGYRGDMPEVLAQSALVVLPSYYREGLPTVLLEAAAAGRAVVTTDMPGCRDAVIPGVTGLLVPPRDANALASAIAQLLNDRERLRAMGQAGRELAEREFGVRGVADKYMDIYRELLAEREGA